MHYVAALALCAFVLWCVWPWVFPEAAPEQPPEAIRGPGLRALQDDNVRLRQGVQKFQRRLLEIENDAAESLRGMKTLRMRYTRDEATPDGPESRVERVQLEIVKLLEDAEAMVGPPEV